MERYIVSVSDREINPTVYGPFSKLANPPRKSDISIVRRLDSISVEK